MERKSNKNRYQNPFHNVKYQDSKPFIETVATPVFYNGYLIYHRVQSSRADANVYDIVKDGVCVGMYAGSNGAKKAIDKVTARSVAAKRSDCGGHFGPSGSGIADVTAKGFEKPCSQTKSSL